MTLATQRVLRVLLADPSRDHYGLEVGAAADLPSGTIHPILARLEAVGWLESSWEDADPRVEGRPARRYYRLSAAGAEAAQSALARVAPRRSPSPLRAAPSGH
ncbi:Transcriptional regulator PadR-like family protein [Pedococcus dokdonensis]|uniref:Transcriptional regulator PadR-like family protein n=2 Tax=Pedococcus dokdonensis TaxID=443156 RepID=A0A1H0QYD6_9MICO|nr:Transcriptional regulator PadR-like family protein [Pedococcus dokdonensis]